MSLTCMNRFPYSCFMEQKKEGEPKKALREVANILAKVDDPELIYGFLECLLTPYEISEISSRWNLVKLIDQGISQRKIASELGLSLCKITRGSKELKKKNSPFKKFIDIKKQLDGVS